LVAFTASHHPHPASLNGLPASQATHDRGNNFSGGKKACYTHAFFP
jgi:hypothetical protein